LSIARRATDMQHSLHNKILAIRKHSCRLLGLPSTSSILSKTKYFFDNNKLENKVGRNFSKIFPLANVEKEESEIVFPILLAIPLQLNNSLGKKKRILEHLQIVSIRNLVLN
jgi:hypothetical protein